MKPGRVIAFVCVAIAAGSVAGWAAGRGFHDLFDPHADLASSHGDRVYVSESCHLLEVAEQMLQDEESETESQPSVLVISVDPVATPSRTAICERLLERTRPSVWWTLLPSGYLCDRLSQEARTWAQSRTEVLPLWVIDGKVVGSGMSPDTLAKLRELGIVGESSAAVALEAILRNADAPPPDSP